MQSPQVSIWMNESVGIAWMINEIEGVRVFSHLGGTTGQVSLLQLVPERDFAIAVLTNADLGGLLTQETSRWVFKQYLELEMPDLKPIESSEEELAFYTGHYSQPYMDIDLGMLAGKLVGQWKVKGSFPTKDSPPPPVPPPMSLALCEKDHLLVLDGPTKGMRGEVIRKPDGSIRWLRFGGRIHIRES